MHCTVYIPSEPHHAVITDGSGIVGVECGDMLEIWFEGNVYGAVNLVEYRDRVACAASRMVERYPTRARALVVRDSLRPVGSFDTDTGTLTLTDPGAVAAWTDNSAERAVH